MNKSKHMKEQEKRHKSLETNLTEGLQLFSWTNISLQVNATALLFECSVALFFFFNFCCDLEKEKKNQCQHAGIFFSINKCTGSWNKMNNIMWFCPRLPQNVLSTPDLIF